MLVPIPKPVRTTVDYVAAYYLTGWGAARGQRSADWALGTDYHSLLGEYNSADPHLADWHIKMAVENGVNVFMVPSSRPAAHWRWETNFENGLLKAKYLEYVNFAMMFNNEPWWDQSLGGITKEELTVETMNYFAQKYFTHPRYLFIEYKPVVVLYHAFIYHDRFGLEALKRLVSDLRETARSNGYKVYLIGDVMNTWHSERLGPMIELFDAISSYNILNAGSKWTHPGGKPTVVAPYSEMVSGYIQESTYFAGLAKQYGKAFIPPAIPGFDNSRMQKAGIDNWLVVRTEPTPAKFREMLEGVRGFALVPSMIILEAWNEFQEGTVLEPTKENSYLYLEQVRDVFGVRPPEGWPPHAYPVAAR